MIISVIPGHFQVSTDHFAHIKSRSAPPTARRPLVHGQQPRLQEQPELAVNQAPPAVRDQRIESSYFLVRMRTRLTMERLSE
jgi:hypothetical protein